MDRKDLKTHLHTLADVRGNITPRADFVHQTRKNLLSSLEHSTSLPKTRWFSFARLWEVLAIIVPNHTVYAVVRPVVMVVLVFGLATGSWITGVFATSNSTEGDAGYFVKLSIEKTTEVVVGLTQGEVAKKKLQAEHATRRLQEVKQILATIDQDDTTAATRVQKTVERFKDSAAQVQEALDTLQGEEVIDLAQAVEEVSEDVAEILDETHETLVDNTMIPEEVTYIVRDAVEAAAATETKTVEVYVESLAAGEDVVSVEDVKEVIDKQIQRIESTVEGAQQDVQDAVESLENIPGGLEVGHVEVIDPAQEEVVSKSDEVKNVLKSAKELLEDEAFDEVLEKVNGAAPLSNDVQSRAVEVGQVAAKASTEQVFVPGGLQVQEENVTHTTGNQDSQE